MTLHTFVRAFLILDVCGLSIASLHAEDCSTPDLTLTYPELANVANVTGDLVLHVRINRDGTPSTLGIKGRQDRKRTRLLSKGAEETLATIRFPIVCANQTLDLEFSYRKDNPVGPRRPGISKRVGPNHFEVRTNRYATDQRESL